MLQATMGAASADRSLVKVGAALLVTQAVAAAVGVSGPATTDRPPRPLTPVLAAAWVAWVQEVMVGKAGAVITHTTLMAGIAAAASVSAAPAGEARW
jgi:hypothetical protein